MNMKIKLPKCKFRLFIFILYNLFFVLYMANKISNIYYLVTISFFCLTNLFMLLTKKIKIKYGFKEFKLGVTYVAVLFIISLIIQFYHGNFGFRYLFNDIIRMILPIINAFLFVNTIDKKDFPIFFNVFLLRFILQFVFINLTTISINSILSISWITSSSLMESSLAHDFMIMEMYYLMNKEKNKALICLIFCMLSMKRLSFILAPLLFIISKYIDKNEVKGKVYNFVKIITILSPIIVLLLYSNKAQYIFLNNFGIDLNSLMTGRIKIYNILSNNIPYYNGLGSINNFLSSFVKSNYGTTWNGILHNDFLRLYLETTIIGVFFVANNLIEISKKNKWHFTTQAISLRNPEAQTMKKSKTISRKHTMPRQKQKRLPHFRLL